MLYIFYSSFSNQEASLIEALINFEGLSYVGPTEDTKRVLQATRGHNGVVVYQDDVLVAIGVYNFVKFLESAGLRRL